MLLDSKIVTEPDWGMQRRIAASVGAEFDN